MREGMNLWRLALTSSFGRRGGEGERSGGCGWRSQASKRKMERTERERVRLLKEGGQ
ncbi:NADPH-dependent oxidoreductase [Sesbania bispinosa]|nr:NADPH-dependent oxidoreductase [Sesbania bispinosa]